MGSISVQLPTVTLDFKYMHVSALDRPSLRRRRLLCLHLALPLAQRVGPRAAAALLEPLLTPFSVGNLDDNRRSVAIQLSSIADFARWCQPAFATTEPHVPWLGGLLTQRVRCYEQTNSPLLPLARHDLDRFERMQSRAR